MKQISRIKSNRELNGIKAYWLNPVDSYICLMSKGGKSKRNTIITHEYLMSNITYKELAKKYMITPERVRQILAKNIRSIALKYGVWRD